MPLLETVTVHSTNSSDGLDLIRHLELEADKKSPFHDQTTYEIRSRLEELIEQRRFPQFQRAHDSGTILSVSLPESLTENDYALMGHS